MAEYAEEQSRVDIEDDTTQVERDAVKKALKEYNTAYEFDKPARKQFAIDRTYAAGRADPSWASDANLIGSFIDILVAFLYARDPDMDCRPAARVGEQPKEDDHAFAETLELVISRLWKDAKLKKCMKKLVRSSLSVGPGWMKALMLTKTQRDPQIEKELNDVQDNLRRLRATERKIEEGDGEDQAALEQQYADQIQGLEAKVEVVIRSGLALDFIRSDDIQVSVDVSEISDYLDADWITHSLYIPKRDLCNRFERLTEEDIKAADCYYQKRPFTEDKDSQERGYGADEGPADEGHFTKTSPNTKMGASDPVEFAKVCEMWDKRDNLIRTFIPGVKKWAVEPYAPPMASTRFYPFFQLAFFEVDGERYPQSLSWRLRKLQDEYSTTRSNFRRVRERIMPGTIFNSSQIDVENAKKLEQSVAAEFTGIKPTNPDADFSKIFAPKPSPNVNHNLYDTQPILSDMERISGVQEALQSTVQTAKTATEANIQQSGFESRTSANRDVLEDLLRDLAHYTAEVALQAVSAEQAQKLAGPLAFWPDGMDIEDILTLVNVDIDAGSTGKPSSGNEKETWSIVMPMIKEMLIEIRMLQMRDPGLAEAMLNLLRETLHRLDDRFDVDKLIPQGDPPPPPIPPGAGVPGGAADVPLPPAPAGDVLV